MNKHIKLFLLLLFTITLAGCRKADYTTEEICEFVSQRYGEDYSYIGNSGNSYSFKGTDGKVFTVRQDRTSDPEGIFSEPILRSSFLANKYSEKLSEVDTFISRNNLDVTLERKGTYYDYTIENATEAESRGLKDFIEEQIDYDLGCTGYTFSETLTVYVTVYNNGELEDTFYISTL